MTPTWHPCAEGEKLYQAYCAVMNTDWRALDTATAPSHEVVVAWNAWLEHVERCESFRIERENDPD